MASKNMESDYLWVRNAPTELATTFKNHGNIFIYDRAPNHIQRLEMMYRSIGKTYDWQLEKFRLSKKVADKGNRRRFHKNAARFFKNPIGYIIWRAMPFIRASQPRLFTYLLFTSTVCVFLEWKYHSDLIQDHDKLLLASGKNIQGITGRYTGYHDTVPLKATNIFEQTLRANIQLDQIIINPTWKQNIRKQLQLINSNGVRF